MTTFRCSISAYVPAEFDDGGWDASVVFVEAGADAKPDALLAAVRAHLRGTEVTKVRLSSFRFTAWTGPLPMLAARCHLDGSSID